MDCGASCKRGGDDVNRRRGNGGPGCDLVSHFVQMGRYGGVVKRFDGAWREGWLFHAKLRVGYCQVWSVVSLIYSSSPNVTIESGSDAVSARNESAALRTSSSSTSASSSSLSSANPMSESLLEEPPSSMSIGTVA